jgi:hypothetical protein
MSEEIEVPDLTEKYQANAYWDLRLRRGRGASPESPTVLSAISRADGAGSERSRMDTTRPERKKFDPRYDMLLPIMQQKEQRKEEMKTERNKALEQGDCLSRSGLFPCYARALIAPVNRSLIFTV